MQSTLMASPLKDVAQSLRLTDLDQSRAWRSDLSMCPCGSPSPARRSTGPRTICIVYGWVKAKTAERVDWRLWGQASEDRFVVGS
jgi:hypothetical protein